MFKACESDFFGVFFPTLLFLSPGGIKIPETKKSFADAS